MLSRCHFHRLVDNSISPQKKICSTFGKDQYFSSEIKILRSVVGGKVDGQFLFGTRSEKPKMLIGTSDEKRKQMYLAPNDSFEKFYFAVKGLITTTKFHLTSIGSHSSKNTHLRAQSP